MQLLKVITNASVLLRTSGALILPFVCFVQKGGSSFKSPPAAISLFGGSVPGIFAKIFPMGSGQRVIA